MSRRMRPVVSRPSGRAHQIKIEEHTVDLATEVTLTKKVRAGSVDLWEQKPDSSSHLIEFPE